MNNEQLKNWMKVEGVDPNDLNRALETKPVGRFSRRQVLVGLGSGIAGAAVAACTPGQVDRALDIADRAVPPVSGATTEPIVAGVTADAAGAETILAPDVTVQEALRAAAQAHADKTNGDVETLTDYITEIYDSMPSDMPFIAQGKKGLMPHETQATAFDNAKPSKDANNPSIREQASMRGFYAVSGGYLFATVDNKYKLELPWQDKTTYNVYFVGPTDRNVSVGLYDYAQGGTFGTGASYDAGQEPQYPNREMLDKVWLADGIMQAALRDGSSGQTYEVIVDTTTGAVSTFTYNVTTKAWSEKVGQLPNLK